VERLDRTTARRRPRAVEPELEPEIVMAAEA
jgi:hypothetical protein